MRWLIVILCLTYTTIISAQNILYAELSASEIYAGSDFTIEYRYTGEGKGQFIAPSFSPFRVVAGPRITQHMSNINGRVSRYTGHGYTLKATGVGAYTIAPAAMIVNGKRYESQPLTIRVQPPLQADQILDNATDTDAPVFIQASISDSIMYVGQQVVLTYRLFTQVDIGRVDFRSYPDFNYFSAENIASGNPTSQRVDIGGKTYVTQIIKQLLLNPNKSGTTTIMPAQIQVMIPNKTRRSFFDNYQLKQLTTNAVPVVIRSLPSPRPPDFSGLVGSYEFDVTPHKTSIDLDDAISFQMGITGDPVPEEFKAPTVLDDDRLTAYDPTITQNQHTGGTDLEYIYTTNHPGAYYLQPRVTYFDTDSMHDYVTWSSDTIHYQVTGERRQVAPQAALDSLSFARVGPGRHEAMQWALHPIFTYLWYALVAVVLGLLAYRYLPWFQREEEVEVITPQEHILATIQQMSTSTDVAGDQHPADLLYDYIRLQADVPPPDWTRTRLKDYLMKTTQDAAYVAQVDEYMNRGQYAAWSGKSVQQQTEAAREAMELLERLEAKQQTS